MTVSSNESDIRAQAKAKSITFKVKAKAKTYKRSNTTEPGVTNLMHLEIPWSGTNFGSKKSSHVGRVLHRTLLAFTRWHDHTLTTARPDSY